MMRKVLGFELSNLPLRQATQIALMLFVVFAAMISAQAQVTGGAVTGTVVDPNGAVVHGATVLLKDKARGLEFTAVTTDAGSYRFPNVQTGTYTMTVTATGFTE